MKKFTLLYLLLALAMVSCRKDFEETTVIKETYQPPVIKVQGDVAGLVVDENGNALESVSVTYDQLSTLTDAKGLFLFQDITLNAGGSFIKAEADGYFQGSSRIFPQANSQNFIRIKMMEKIPAGTVAGDTGGTLSFDGAASVKLEANSFVGSDGNAYIGTVNVAARWIDPSGRDLYDVMPGNLQGVDEKNEEVSLATYGMMAVELTGENGEALDLAEGFTAQLSFPLPAGLQSGAPAGIPLWYFDEAIGLWVEEGSATLQGDRYVGEVAHFSFWNCDYPYPLVNLSGTVVNENGDPFSGIQIQITIAGGGGNPGNASVGYGYTDANGIFSGKVPEGESLTITILDPCGEVAYTDDIGPFSANTDLGEIVVNGVATISLSGVLVNCDNDPVENGVLVVTLSDRELIIYSGADGTFGAALLNCDETSLSVQGYDTETLLYGNATDFTITDPLEVGTISACENAIEEYIRIEVLGAQRVYVEPYAFSTPVGRTTISNADADSLAVFNLQILGLEAGTYSGQEIQFNYYDYNISPALRTSCGLQGTVCNGLEVTITSYGEVGEPIIGTFTGTLDFFQDNQTLLPDVPFSGDFRVYRE